MEVKLLTISKGYAEILNECSIYLNTEKKVVKELYDRVYDLYPTLKVNHYKLYWQYNKDKFFKICDYFTYVSAFTVMVDKIVMLVLENCDLYCVGKNLLLKTLDSNQISANRVNSKLNIKNCLCGSDSLLLLLKTDSQILKYAIRTKNKPEYYTEDLRTKMHAVQCFKKGWPKRKEKLVLLGEEVLERLSKVEVKTKK